MNDTNQAPLPAPPTPPAPPAQTGNNQGALVVGGVLILLGVIFLAFNVFHIDFGRIWPIIFFIIGAGFYVPVLLIPHDRRNLAGLLIPGTILFGLGTIFFYNVLTDQWDAWAYIWTLIPASVGLGLLIAARVGHWGGDTARAGFWMFVLSIGACLILAAFFGGGNAGAIGAILLIALGFYLLIQSVRRSTTT